MLSIPAASAGIGAAGREADAMTSSKDGRVVKRGEVQARVPRERLEVAVHRGARRVLRVQIPHRRPRSLLDKDLVEEKLENDEAEPTDDHLVSVRAEVLREPRESEAHRLAPRLTDCGVSSVPDAYVLRVGPRDAEQLVGMRRGT